VKKPVVGVVGLGLIGGSLARALSRRGHAVIGVDTSAPAARAAKRARAVESVADLEAACARADVLFLAAPPRANMALVRRLSKIAPPRLVVSDVSSVKQPIVSAARRAGLERFVGGHPMAGRARGGFAASDAELFRDRPWLLTVSADQRAVKTVAALVRSIGARPVVLGAAEHDRVVAFLSHLPQIVAWGLARCAVGDPVAGRRLALAGPAFADMTRLAKSPRALWAEILELNRVEIRGALRAFRGFLSVSL
jgi:prephenate dehydrogenase